MGNDVIISLDQAKETGWCVSIGDEIEAHGALKSKEKDYHDVAHGVKIFLDSLCQEYKPLLLTFEDVHGGLNSDTSKKLGILLGVLVEYAIDNNILFKVIKPSTWQGKNGLCFDKTKTRKLNTKQQSVIFANTILSEGKVSNDNEADAICMNYYARNNIKIVEST